MTLVGILLLIIHIIACSGLILIVLLQAGKGASLGASFGGGSSQTVFGARSATFIGRLTWVLAGAFMATSLLLTVISPWGGRQAGTASGILHEEPVTLPPVGSPSGATQPTAGEWPQQTQPAAALPAQPPTEPAGTLGQGEKTTTPKTPAKSQQQSKSKASSPAKQKHP
ncbi:preprotein translocase subunit SecG [Candidatus Poribacteria bacterium]|nr:preprotein translocase subunit SecG [Candidatus Poribacteria bacterium]